MNPGAHMWNDIVIGEGDKLCSAWIIYEVPDGPSISHNRVSYWITGCWLDIGMTIMKDTPEGVALTRFLAIGQPDPEALRNWLTEVVLRQADPKVLVLRHEEALKKAFRAGQDAKAAELRDVLGIER